MNITFFIFWIIIFICIGVLIFLTVRNIKGIEDQKTNPYNLNTSALQQCYPKSTLTDLPEITATTQCSGSTKYRFQNSAFLQNSEVLVDISPLAYLQACEPFCLNYDILQSVCNDDSARNPLYTQCTNELKPVQGCLQTAMPVAYKDSTPYYLVQKSFAGCT